MGLFAGRDDRDQTVARLQGDLEKTQIRLEEVAAYYRGELETVRRRAEDESVRVQAAEAGRRKRAEEQVAYLKGELQSARTEAEHAQRRYQDLLQRLDELETQSEQDTRDEMDRFREAAKAAWKTAEEEVERLDRELAETCRKREQESEERRQLERSYEQLEERHQLEKRDRLRLIGRLKRGLKASEARRQAAESAASVLPRFADRPERVVDPSREWAGLPLGNADDFSDEFLMADGDESFAVRRQEPKVGNSAPLAREPGGEEVSDMEAEELMMTLDVDEQVARRQARSGAWRQPPLPPSPPRGAAAASTMRPAKKDIPRGLGWAWLAVAGLVAVGSAVGLLML